MSQPQRWWTGLLLLIPLWIFANWSETPNVEADLMARSELAITSATRMLTGGAVRVAGRDVTISGRALSGDAEETAVAAALATRGVRLVNANIAPADAPKPYPFSAQWDAGALTMTGFAPSPDARAKLLAAARALAGAKVSDQLQLGSGAPPGFEAMAIHGLTQLGKLARGRFSLSDTAYNLTGQAPTSPVYADLGSLAGKLPPGAKAGAINIIAPLAKPFAFSVAREGDRMTLTGFVPSESMRMTLAAAVQKALPSARIEDRTSVASGAPAGFEAIATHGAGWAARLGEGRFDLSDLTYSLSGHAPTAGVHAAALLATAKLPGGAQSGKIEIGLPVVAQYVFEAVRTANGMALSGHAPSSATQVALVEAARAASKGEVSAAITLAAGAPAGFAMIAEHGLKLAAQLIDGKFTLAGGVYSLSGAAPDSAVHTAVLAAVKALPVGASAGKIAVLAPHVSPYTFSARVEGGRLVLDGFVPEENQRAALAQQAAKLFPGVSIDNRLQIARGAPQGFAGAVSGALAQIAALKGGALELRDGAYRISGEAASRAAADGLAAALKGAIGGAGLDTSGLKFPPPVVEPPKVDIPEPPPVVVIVPKPEPPQPVESPAAKAAVATQTAAISCIAADRGAILRETIHFNPADRRVAEAERKSLQRVLEVARACPMAKIEINGHADARGDRRSNIVLSSRRTFSTSRFLFLNGVDRSRISTRSFGEDRPVADNVSAGGRARNRRVEIIVR